jgi:hypothetical protein
MSVRPRLAVLGASLLLCGPAAGSVPELTSLDAPVTWPSTPVEIRLTGQTLVDYSLVQDSVAWAAASWSAIPHSAIALTTVPSPETPEPVSGNGLDEYGWIETTDHPWIAPSSPCSTVTLTVAATGERLEADTWCNAAHFVWQLDELDGAYEPSLIDPRRAALHELGHWLGLDHVLLFGELMDPRTLPGATTAGLGSLEAAFARERYPSGSSPHGSLAGRVVRGEAGVPYAHVLAVELDTGALQGTVTRPDGTYRLAELPAGRYRLLARPLTTDPVLVSAPYRANPPAQLDFLATPFPGGVLVLGPGEDRLGIDIPVPLVFGPDPWEPDDDLTTASPLAVGAFEIHHFHSALDRDVFTFVTTPGRCATIHTELTGASIAALEPERFWARTRLEVRDASQVLVNDSRDSARDDPRSWVTWCETGAPR